MCFCLFCCRFSFACSSASFRSSQALALFLFFFSNLLQLFLRSFGSSRSLVPRAMSSAFCHFSFFSSSSPHFSQLFQLLLSSFCLGKKPFVVFLQRGSVFLLLFLNGRGEIKLAEHDCPSLLVLERRLSNCFISPFGASVLSSPSLSWQKIAVP